MSEGQDSERFETGIQNQHTNTQEYNARGNMPCVGIGFLTLNHIVT